MRKATKIVALVAVLGLVLAGCGKSSNNAKKKSTGPITLNLGVVTSLTGDLAPYGKASVKAVQLAVGLLNDALTAAGSTSKIKLVGSEDDLTKATGGVEAANKLVSEGATALVGSLASAVTIPIATSVSSVKNIVQISPASTAAGITSLKDNGYLFRSVISDFLQAKLLVPTLEKIFGKTAKINVGARNDPYGTGLEDAFSDLWKANGGTIGAKVKWDPKAASFDSEAQELVSGNPDGWLIIDFPLTWKKSGTALLQTGKWDIKKTFTTDGLKDTTLKKDVGNSLAEGLRGTAPGPSEKGSAPASAAFDALWKAKAKIDRQTFDAQAFDAAMMIGLAALAAGSAAGPDIRDHLKAVSSAPGTQYTFENLTQAVKDVIAGKDIDYQGASSPCDLDDNGDLVPTGATYEVWQYHNGKVVVNQTIKAGEIT
jgi:ABC-type branched-subunit amino acid transport system substrate-binding protein